MKKLVEVIEVPGQGLEALLGENVILLCANYFYAGKLTGVNDTFVELSEASLVYETGPWTQKGYSNAQKLPGATWNVQIAAIESFGLGK